MIIDCASCIGRPTECGDCVISVVLGSHPGSVDLDADEQTAVAALAGSGLVPPLRLMPLPIVSSDPADPIGSSESAGPIPVAEPPGRSGTASRWSRHQRTG
jgi:hypothetical protein